MPIKYNDVVKLPNGAQFYTADLHVHTYGASPCVSDKSMTVEAVIDQAVMSGIGVMAISDHNTVRNTERSLEYAQKYIGQLLVLAAVEVSTANGHILAFFAPEALHQLSNFVGRIGIVKPGTSDSHTTMSMSDVATEAYRLDGICLAAHIDRDKTGFETLVSGYPNWKRDIILNAGIVGLEVDDPAHLLWYSTDDEVTPEGAERKKLIEQRSKSPGAAARAVLAHVQNSDAHSLQDFIDAQQKRSLTRLKMDTLSFQGFRTALADPEARVRAVAEVPPAIPKILGMHVEGGFLHAETYRLSDNLTCFIGGRGTGKSTALRSLAYGLGAHDGIADYDNCPATIVVYCRDAQGIAYRYERMRGSEEPSVQAWEGGKTIDAPPDVFRVEYYGQGDLARVAEDPLTKAHLLQEFLDRHAHLSDLASKEAEVLGRLEQNGSLLRPLEVQEATRTNKDTELKACDKKLQLAEEGQLKAIAARQAAIGAEKGLAKTLTEIRDSYSRGITLDPFLRNYDATAAGAGTLTGDATSERHLATVKAAIEDANRGLKEFEAQLASLLRKAAQTLDFELKALVLHHRQLEQGIAQQVADLQRAGLSASLADHNKVVARRSALARELAQLDQRLPELKRLRQEREELLADLAAGRAERSTRRKDQVKVINKHLAKAIDDYTIVVYYDDKGLVGRFREFIVEEMRGTYLQEEAARRLCLATTPQELARLVATGNVGDIAKLDGLGVEMAGRLCERLSKLDVLHRLQALDKPPCPIIKVVTKGGKSQQIPVNQLSDGQKHTILLTIAMQAESEVPLVIDQPEDDLDNAFIFSSVVRMLREVKERRQVILVTHNANIAVLGDAELLFPMRRNGDRGSSFDAGSVDRAATKRAAQAILEGGELAFLRRKEIYGH
ncbi:MAG: AAA family ATPase [Myxococcota bacterium]|nr:AAA family ATPase [Myxococcota bacterium]